MDGDCPSYELEFRLRHEDGSYRWIHTRGLAQRDASGRPTRVIGCHVDLTDHKASESTLRDIVGSVGATTGEAFFQGLVAYLWRRLRSRRGVGGRSARRRPRRGPDRRAVPQRRPSRSRLARTRVRAVCLDVAIARGTTLRACPGDLSWIRALLALRHPRLHVHPAILECRGAHRRHQRAARQADPGPGPDPHTAAGARRPLQCRTRARPNRARRPNAGSDAMPRWPRRCRWPCTCSTSRPARSPTSTEPKH